MNPYQLHLANLSKLIQSRNPFPTQHPTRFCETLWLFRQSEENYKIISTGDTNYSVVENIFAFLFCFCLCGCKLSLHWRRGREGGRWEIVNCTEGTRPTAPWKLSFKYTFVSILQIYTNIRKKGGYKVRKMSKGQSVNFLYHPIFQRTFGIDALFS